MPDERYRALVWAHGFLQDLLDPKKTPRVPQDIRHQALVILRHYPGPGTLSIIAQDSPEWLNEPGVRP